MNLEQKTCKNKNCQKVLPIGYKHRYCEACRNVQIENVKKGAKAVGGTILSIGLLVVGGKTFLKNKISLPWCYCYTKVRKAVATVK